MSLALVGDRYGIQPQKLFTIFPACNVLYIHILLFLQSLLSLLLFEKDMVGWY